MFTHRKSIDPSQHYGYIYESTEGLPGRSYSRCQLVNCLTLRARRPAFCRPRHYKLLLKPQIHPSRVFSFWHCQRSQLEPSSNGRVPQTHDSTLRLSSGGSQLTELLVRPLRIFLYSIGICAYLCQSWSLWIQMHTRRLVLDLLWKSAAMRICLMQSHSTCAFLHACAGIESRQTMHQIPR